MTDQQWSYVDAAGNQMGPVPIENLRSLYQQGAITAETPVWGPGLSDWTPAGQVPNLLAAASPAPATAQAPAAAAAPAAASASPQWYFMDGAGTRHGPVDVEQLRSLQAAGSINHTTMVWHEGAANWQPAGNIPNLLAPAAVHQPAMQQPVMGQTQAVGAMVGTATAGMHTTQSFGGDADDAVPSWMGSANIGTILVALALFFLPWVEMRCASMGGAVGMMMSGQEPTKEPDPDKKIAYAQQTGFETMTGGGGLADEFIEEMGIKEEQLEKMEEEQKKSSGEDDLDPAWFVIAAVACLAIALVLAIMALSSGNRMHHLIAQGGITAALALIGTQMLLGFPLENEMQKGMEEQKEEAGKLSEEEMEKMEEQLNKMIEIRYTHWLYVEMGVLAIGLVLLFVTIGTQPKRANPYGFR